MKKLILILFAILLVGAGCNETNETNVELHDNYLCVNGLCEPLPTINDEKVTLKSTKPIKTCTTTFYPSRQEQAEPVCTIDPNKKVELPIKDFLQLLADQYEYQQEETDTKPARLIKIK